MAEPNGNQLKVKGPFGIDLAAQGTTLIAIIAVAAFIGFAMWQDYKRNVLVQEVITTVRNENKWVREVIEKVGCHVQFNTWMGRIPKDSPIDWHALPESLYGCIPESLTGRRK